MSPDHAEDETIPVALPFADFNNPQSLNLYSYAGNNPLSSSDPDGHDYHVCVGNGSGSQNCINLSDDQYKQLNQQQNGQQGINLPGFPGGTITCGGSACGSASYFERGLQDESAGQLMMFLPLEKLAAPALGALGRIGEALLGRIGGEAAGAAANAAGGVLASGSKAAIKDALENGVVNEAQKGAVKRALARGKMTDTFTIEKLGDGSIKVTQSVAGRAGGHATYEKVVDAVGIQFPDRLCSAVTCLAERRSILTQNTKDRRQLTPEEKELLAQFARFEIGLEELTLRLRGMLELDFGAQERRLVSHFLLPEPGVRVELSHVRKAMEKHWNGEVSDDELYRWATMLLLNEAYDWAGPDEDEIAELLNELAILPKPAED